MQWSVNYSPKAWVRLVIVLIILLGADVPNVLTQGLVLALTLEGKLVKRHLVWICQTRVHHSCHSSELSLVVFLCLRVSGRAFAVRLSVVELTCLAVREADFVALSHFAVDYLHGESIFYMCHSCSAIERESKKQQGFCINNNINNLLRAKQHIARSRG